MIWEALGEHHHGLLEEAVRDGHLLDFYSEEWLAANAARFALPARLQGQTDDRCMHHLHVLCIDSQFMVDLLLQVAPELGWQFGQNSPHSGLAMHEPDFVFFNTLEALIISVGLGRKNRLFALSARRDETISLDVAEAPSECSDPLIKRFIRLDHGMLFWKLSSALEQLGESYYYERRKLTVSSRAKIRDFFPFLDTRKLNTRDY